MKKIFLSLLFVFLFALPAVAAGQKTVEQKEPTTKIEAFLSRKGEIYIKDFYEIGSHFYPGNITLTAVVLFKPGQEAQKIKGMKIEVKEEGPLERSNVAFLDMEEIESLSKALAYLENLAGKWKDIEKSDSEAVYTTKDYFTMGFYKSKGEMKGFASCGFVGKTNAFFPVEDLKKVRISVEKGLQLLREK